MNQAIKNRVWAGAGIAMVAGTLWLVIFPSDDLEKDSDVMDTGIQRQSTQGDARTAPRPPLRILPLPSFPPLSPNLSQDLDPHDSTLQSTH